LLKQIGRDPSTISRELIRNPAPNKSGYHAASARLRTQERRHRANQRCRTLSHNKPLQRKIERKLKREWSPEEIAGWCGNVSHPTIYRWIYEERRDLKQHLRHGGSRWRRKRGTHERARAREEAKKRRIDERPKVVEQRFRLGDWEGDTVVGTDRKAAILTHVERKSGYVFLDKLDRALAQTVREKTRQRFVRLPRKHRRTITYDNGSEFAAHEFIERETKATVYFAHPYSSWERGTNENTNGLLRQYLPKKTSFTDVTQAELDRIAWLLNTRPRKRLNWRTPAQVLKQ
jgi:IS30 family transposase